MSYSERARDIAVATAMLLVCTALGGESVLRQGPGRSGPGHRGATDGVTVEPQPALTADLVPVEIRRHARGGAGLLLLKVASAISLDEVVIDLRVPEGVTLADGSRARSWRTGLSGGRGLTLPIEVLAARDGSHVLRAEIVGSHGGRTIRRGIAYTLDLGVTRSLPPFRNGAYEYRGVANLGGR